MIWNLRGLMQHCNECQAEIYGKWVPARPINYQVESWRERIRAAWMVLTGKADAVIWPGGQ